MEINDMRTGGVNGPNPARRSTPAAPSQSKSSPSLPVDGVSLSGAAGLETALQATPDVRPEAVANGASLAADPNYPGAEAIQKLSRFLAENFVSSAE